jgi:hypothetical protein
MQREKLTVHLLVALLVVRRIDQDLIKDLVQTGHKSDALLHHSLGDLVEHKHLLRLGLN